MKRAALIAVVVAFAAFGAGAMIAAQRSPAPQSVEAAVPRMKPFEGVRDIAPFALVDHHGRAFDQSRLRGRWSLVTFGFASCPDLCPTMLTNLVELRKALALKWQGPEPQFVFVSLDPARDTQAVLAQYVPAFDPGFVGATGAQTAVDRLHTDLGGAHRIARKPGASSESYSVDHSVLLYVVNPHGRLHAQIAPPFDPAGVAGQVARFAKAFAAEHPSAAAGGGA